LYQIIFFPNCGLGRKKGRLINPAFFLWALGKIDSEAFQASTTEALNSSGELHRQSGFKSSDELIIH